MWIVPSRPSLSLRLKENPRWVLGLQRQRDLVAPAKTRKAGATRRGKKAKTSTESLLRLLSPAQLKAAGFSSNPRTGDAK